MTDGKTDSKLTGVALVAAFIVLAAWLALLSWLAFHTGATEVQWARLSSVLGSLEAVAFAAAGALFGTTVQKQRVEDAKERAGKAEKAATNGQKLAAEVKARAGTRATMQGVERVSATERPGEALNDLAALAARLFPD